MTSNGPCRHALADLIGVCAFCDRVRALADQALRMHACFINMNERVLHNVVTALGDYELHPRERVHLRLGPVAEVEVGEPARWLDVCEEPLEVKSDLFPATAQVKHVCGCSDVRLP